MATNAETAHRGFINHPLAAVRRVSTPSNSSAAAAAANERVRAPPKEGQCTHLTTTRLFTKDFRCVCCCREGSFGWLYRCTQDRDNLLEDEIERGYVDKFDGLCHIFSLPGSPRPRTAAARANPLSFLDENSDEALEAYSTKQLVQILRQRGQALDQAIKDKEAKAKFEQTTYDSRPTNPFFTPNQNSLVVQESTNIKPWLPFKGQECQFKCCQFCRSNLSERSFLSLDGIMKGDIPPTAIAGFGFHLARSRPVALVKHVQNLGLRPSPPPQPRSSSGPLRHQRYFPLGLGIASPPGLQLIASSSSTVQPHRSFPSLTTAISSNHPLPSTTFTFHYPSPIVPHPQLRSPHIDNPNYTFDLAMACLSPLPPQTVDELALISAPLTPMEELELDGGRFSSAPLEVNDGVAVTEESVGMRVADVITQF